MNENDQPITIILADDHQVVRQGLRALLEREGFQVLGEAADGNEAVRLAKELSPDVAVIDFGMPKLNGLDASLTVMRECPRTTPILLTVHTEDQYVLRALEAGIRGYVVKTQAMTDLVRAIQEVRAGSIYLSPTISQTVVEAYLGKKDMKSDPLTPRERQVLQLVAEGMSSKQVASALHISVKTAESHRGRLMQKLNIHETASLVRYAIRSGIVQP